ncbi:HPr(Ser) kinase/phosphatase [Verrucomicrobiota bacterium]
MEQRNALKIKDLWEAGRESLLLELIVEEGLEKRTLTEMALNRGGLGLTGFFQYFADKRLQIFGLAELTYLKSLSEEEQKERLDQFCEKCVPGIVLTRGSKAPKVLLEQARKHKVPVFCTDLVTSDFINKCTLVIENLTAPHKRVQGTMMEITGLGVLLRGRSGIGKSETALALIDRGHSLVSDDVTEVRRDSISHKVLGSANELTRYHMEIRGLGIIHVPSLYGVASIRGEKTVDLVIDLEEQTGDEEFDRTGTSQAHVDLLGVEVPWVVLPVSAGKDTAGLVEATALNYKLQRLGHDAAKELDEKLMNRLSKRGLRD